jgi:hypothetical protein
MCLFLGTLLGALAAGAEAVANEALQASDATDHAGVVVSVSAGWNSALLDR